VIHAVVLSNVRNARIHASFSVTELRFHRNAMTRHGPNFANTWLQGIDHTVMIVPKRVHVANMKSNVEYSNCSLAAITKNAID
jgi:hypothetical protein